MLTTKEDVANALLRLTYGDLLHLGEELAAMCEDKKVRPPPTEAQDFANMLHDWAKACDDE